MPLQLLIIYTGKEYFQILLWSFFIRHYIPSRFLSILSRLHILVLELFFMTFMHKPNQFCWEIPCILQCFFSLTAATIMVFVIAAEAVTSSFANFFAVASSLFSTSLLKQNPYLSPIASGASCCFISLPLVVVLSFHDKSFTFCH